MNNLYLNNFGYWHMVNPPVKMRACKSTINSIFEMRNYTGTKVRPRAEVES